jgi:hypothetical protein
LHGVPEDVVGEIGEGENGGCGGKRGLNKQILTVNSGQTREKCGDEKNNVDQIDCLIDIASAAWAHCVSSFAGII